MAQPPLERFASRNLALKIQAASGAPEAPNNAVDGIALLNGTSGTEFDAVEETRDRAHFSGDDFAISNERGWIQGTFHLVPPEKPGDADDGTPVGHALLLPGGMTRVLDAGNKVTRYNPISTGIARSTAYWSHAGLQKRIYDARHAITGMSLQIGQRAQMQVRIQGSYNQMHEVPLPVVNVASEDGPIISARNSVTQVTVLSGGAPTALNVWGKQLSVDFGSEVTSKEYTELKTTDITDRKGSFTLRIAKTALADFDPWAVRAAGLPIAATLRVTGAEHIYTLLGIRGKIREINEVENDKDYGWEITGPCIASPSGGDEFYLEFGDSTP